MFACKNFDNIKMRGYDCENYGKVPSGSITVSFRSQLPLNAHVKRRYPQLVHSIFFKCELRMAYSVLQKVVKTRVFAWGHFKLNYIQLNTFPF